MNCDKTRINNIEISLKKDPDSISTNDLIYYLKCNSNNTNLDPNNLDNTNIYLKKINNSYFYENIFVNTSNYSSIVFMIIGLLIPFYYFYPRFYKIGFIGFSIGALSLISLYSKINSLYKNFFNNVGIIFITLTFFIYIIFFIVLNKLNHISLFFISSIISYLIINYFLRIILTFPIKKNPYNKNRATMNGASSSTYTAYNELLETTCYQIISRNKLKLPTGVMLYTYLSEFKIEDNNSISDFIISLISPFISIFILIILGNFLSLFNDINILPGKSIQLFPIIGINDSDKYFTCQANYILPKELNINLLIHELLDEYKFNDITYNKIEKALIRISKELLSKYNPKFITYEYTHEYTNEYTNNEFKISENNKKKIYKDIIDILKKIKIDFGSYKNNEDIYYKIINVLENKNNSNIDKNLELMVNDKIPYKIKVQIKDLLNNIKNSLIIINEDDNAIINQHRNNEELAKDELLYDKELNKILGNKKKIEEIIVNYIENFKKNLNLIPKTENKINEQIGENFSLKFDKKESVGQSGGEFVGKIDEKSIKESVGKISNGLSKESSNFPINIPNYSSIETPIKKSNNLDNNFPIKNQNESPKENYMLYGYHYNIISYSFLSENIRKKSNYIFKNIIRLFSTWLLFTKPIGSPWLILKYVLMYSIDFDKLLKKITSKSIIWKYFSMGLDTSYLEDVYKNKNNENSIYTQGKNLFYSILLFVLFAPLLYMYNKITFGFTTSPSWYNLLYQILFIINIYGNIYCFHSKKSFLYFNIIYFILFILIVIILSVITYFLKNKK